MSAVNLAQLPKGVDHSSWQGSEKFPGGLSFGMTKATEGTGYVNPAFANQWGELWNYDPSHHTPRFAYHYFHPELPVLAQATHFVETVKAHGLLPGDNLVMDYELPADGKWPGGMAPMVAARNGCSFLNTVNGLAPNHRVLVYTNPATARTGSCMGMNNWGLWIADWGVSEPHVPAPWHDWMFWQETDKPEDMDYFNGSDSDLLVYTRMKVARLEWAR